MIACLQFERNVDAVFCQSLFRLPAVRGLIQHGALDAFPYVFFFSPVLLEAELVLPLSLSIEMCLPCIREDSCYSRNHSLSQHTYIHIHTLLATL